MGLFSRDYSKSSMKQSLLNIPIMGLVAGTALSVTNYYSIVWMLIILVDGRQFSPAVISLDPIF